MTDDGVRWLDSEEDLTWRSVWSMMTWLPVRLDAHLRAESGLSLAEYNTLSQISEAPDRTVRLSTLAAEANMTLSHLSRVVSRLERSGWVARSPDPDDGRYTLGMLTDAGWEKVVEVAPGHVESVRHYVFDQLTDAESRELGRAAARIAAAVSPSGRAPR